MIECVIAIVSVAGSNKEFSGPRYLQWFDVEAFEGRGWIKTTPDINEAIVFPNFETAISTWRTQSKTVPFRDDGKPNRPLTAYNIEMEILLPPSE